MSHLREMCTDEKKLTRILVFLEAGTCIVRKSDRWTKGAQCSQVNEIGHTLEWYVAEWFRRYLKVPALRGVSLNELRYGGDLDVVAFVNDLRVIVECKATGRPDRFSKAKAQQFLQRVQDFNPEIAVLLFDTERRVFPLKIPRVATHETGQQEMAPNPSGGSPARDDTSSSVRSRR
jgi:hypothetical protein